jgi:hypothetical protein
VAELSAWRPMTSLSLEAINRQFRQLYQLVGGHLDSRRVADSGIGGAKIASLVDDRDTDITYTGTWTDRTHSWGPINGTSRYSVTTGDYLDYTFEGNYIALCGRLGSSSGRVWVFVDGVYDSTVELYSPYSVEGYVFWEKDLQQGRHLIQVQIADTKDPASSGYRFEFDGFLRQRQLSRQHLAVICTSGSMTVTTDASGNGSAIVPATTGHTFLAIVGAQSDVGPGIVEVYGRTIYVRGGPVSGSVEVWESDVQMKKQA